MVIYIEESLIGLHFQWIRGAPSACYCIVYMTEAGCIWNFKFFLFLINFLCIGVVILII